MDISTPQFGDPFRLLISKNKKRYIGGPTSQSSR